MLHPVAEPVPPEPRRPLPALRADQALLSDEEWQALLWPQPETMGASVSSQSPTGVSS